MIIITNPNNNNAINDNKNNNANKNINNNSKTQIAILLIRTQHLIIII